MMNNLSKQALNRIIQDINSQPISDLILSESKVHGARYYCVEPVGGNWFDMEQWCDRQFGSSKTIWEDTCHRWYVNSRKFWFRSESDRTMFILKWR